MADVIPGRRTHDYDGDLVVFLIGMGINKPWRPDLWLPVFLAMPAMLAELSKDKDSGLLGYRLTFGAGGPLLVQYWNSHEKLYRYASDRNAAHRPAWAAFNRRARNAPGAKKTGSVVPHGFTARTGLDNGRRSRSIGALARFR